LARILNADPANLSRELARLERNGLFRSERRGNQKYFRLHKDYALYDEVRRIVEKTIGVKSQLTASLAGIAGVEEAYLYGSYAKDQQDQASDIDVLIVGQPDIGKLEESIRSLERRLRREINHTLLSRKELQARLKKKDPFITDVWKGQRISLLET